MLKFTVPHREKVITTSFLCKINDWIQLYRATLDVFIRIHSQAFISASVYFCALRKFGIPQNSKTYSTVNLILKLQLKLKLHPKLKLQGEGSMK